MFSVLPVQDHPNGISFNIRVQPKSSRSRIEGMQGDALKLRVTAPPIEGAANKACIELLAKALGIPKSSLEVASGHAGRNKRILARCDSAMADRIRQSLRELAGAGASF
jgi:uncharacterized protein (TIGR00251 family)